ncbi:MAG: radical SAM protein [Candidatus Aminicenantales bacterium]
MRESYFPEKIFIEKEVACLPFTHRVIKRKGKIPVWVIADTHSLYEELRPAEDLLGKGKKYLLITRHKGAFVKPCPCTPCYLGCNYFIINPVLNCPLDCSYCILQHYLSQPFITAFANLDDLWKELDLFLEMRGKTYTRIGTGELGDSLALDRLTGLSEDLIEFFRGKEPAVLELKTKTVEIENLLRIDPPENVVISWSLNSFTIARKEERQAPRVEERIQAAAEVLKRGFRLGFHFDPLVFYPGWEEDYSEVVELLMSRVDPARISWISLGALRFPPSLKPVIRARFPRTKIMYEEFVAGIDGKWRYFRPLRTELYQKVVKAIKSSGGEEIPLYFCMESAQVWEKVLGWRPGSSREVEAFLSKCLKF